MSTQTVDDPGTLSAPLSDADRRMRRILRLPPEIDPSESIAGRNAMTTSILVSAVRCLLMYIVLPLVAPTLIKAGGVGPLLGLTVDLVGLTALTVSVRRFFKAHDRRRWHYAAFAACVGAALLAFLVIDLRALL